MKLKSFIIASIIIHVIGAIALYFYYNPIRIGPEPVSSLEEKEALEEGTPAPPPPELITHSPEKAKKPSPEKTSWWKRIKKARKPKEDLKLEESPTSPIEDLSQTKKPEKPKSPVNDFANTPPKKERPPKKPLKAKAPPPIASDLAPENPPSDKPPLEDPPEVIKLELKEIPEPAPSLKTAQLESPPVASPEKSTDPSQETTEDSNPSPEGPSSSQKQESQAQPTEKTTKKAPETASPEKPAPEVSVLNFQGKKQRRGNPPLSYPDFARRAGMQGTVAVSFFVTVRGLVEQIQLEKSSGHVELDNFVIQTLARYEFLPDQEGWVQQEIPFILKGEEVEFLKLRQEN